MRNLGVTLDTRLSWLPHIDQVRKKTAQIMGMLDPLLSRRSDIYIRNGVLLYKQLIRPMMDYAKQTEGRLVAPRASLHPQHFCLATNSILCSSKGVIAFTANQEKYQCLVVEPRCLPKGVHFPAEIYALTGTKSSSNTVLIPCVHCSAAKLAACR
jgi:hypothetical protein